MHSAQERHQVRGAGRPRHRLAGWVVLAAAGLSGGWTAAHGEPNLPKPVAVSLQTPGALAHMTFETSRKHGFYISLRLRYPAGSASSPPVMRQEAVTIATHLTLRRMDGDQATVIFDGDVDALPMGYGADSFDRNLDKFVLAPGRYDVVVSLLHAVPAFAAYPTLVTVASDRGHAVYRD